MLPNQRFDTSRAVGLLFAAAVACLSAAHANAEQLVLRGATMGTSYQVKFVAEPATVDRQRLHADVEQALDQIDRQMSTYRPDSELSRFHRAPAGEWFPVSAATATVVAAAQAISEKTAGALDVTVGPLVRLWSFGPETDRASGQPFHPPADETVLATRKLTGFQKLRVRHEPPALWKELGALDVDLSAIAKGYAVDRLAKIALQHGIAHFMVEIGGEVRAAGTRPDGTPWRVAIQMPIAEARRIHSAVPLADAALATSGDYENYFEHEGRRYSHIIDPATGRPVEHRLASVTVVADDCMSADGWSTALLVLGPDRGFECAASHGIAALFLARTDDGIDARPTPAWRARFEE